MQPSWHKEFTFFWQKKKDEILKAWLKGSIYMVWWFFFPFLKRASAQKCFSVAQRQQLVRAGEMPAIRRERGVGLK